MEEKNNESMYDRLGDLLSKTLEDGFVKIISNESISREKEDLEKINFEKEAEEERQQLHEEIARRLKSKKIQEEKRRKAKTSTIIKHLSPELERAYRLLNITYGASAEEIKKAYRDRLMYFHPDKHKDNPVLQKVANDKTRQILEAYDLIVKNL